MNQLNHSQKLETIGPLASAIAHDFNNLICVIPGYSNLVLKALGKDHKVAKDVEEIKKAGERAASLTRQLLAFSRQAVSQPRAFNLNFVVVDLHGMLQRLIREDIEIAIALDMQLGLVNADPGQIEQVNAGHIEVDTEVGAGTSFRIYFPRVQAEVAVVHSAGSCGRPMAGHVTSPAVEHDELSRTFFPADEYSGQAHAA